MIKVMVADDDFYVQEGLSKFLEWEKMGAELVYLASNGKEIMSALEKESADLLILDIKMPYVTGIEVAKYVKKNMPATQVVLLSAYADFEYAQEAVSAGIREYILKPINHRKLIQLSNIIRDVAAEAEFTKNIIKATHGGTMKEQLEKIISDKDFDSLDHFLTAPEQYKKIDVYRGFCIEILKNVFSLCYGSSEKQKNAETYCHEQLMSYMNIREMKEFTLNECVKCVEFEKSKQTKNEVLIQKIISYVENNYSNPNLNVQNVAERFEYNSDHLSRLFKQQMGVSLQEWIIDFRLKKASELLKNSELTIWQVAERCGYDYIEHFVRLFKKRNGITPTEYRQGVIEE